MNDNEINLYKYKDRVIEIKAAATLNEISKDTEFGKNALLMLLSVTDAHMPSSSSLIFDIYNDSCGDKFIDADKKEIIACLKLWYNFKDMAKKLGITYQYLRSKYFEELNSNYANSDYFNSLTAHYTNSNNYYSLCLFITDFVDKFKFPYADFINKDYEYNLRTLELQFYLIYSKLLEIMQSDYVVGSFINIFCRRFEIDFNSISYLYNKLNSIQRNVQKTVANKHQFLLEYCNMFYLQGIGRGTLANKVFYKASNALSNKYYKDYTKDITSNNYEMMLSYNSTISWSTIKKDEVIKFIKLFYDFVKKDY